ncbi:MAG: hypothetical protein V4726_18650 [Verrucomicrobiota bacterium]
MSRFSPRLRPFLAPAGFALAGMGAAWLFLTLSAPPPDPSAHHRLEEKASAPPGGTAVEAMPQSFLQAGTPMRQMAAALRLAEKGSAAEIRALLDQSTRFPAHSAGRVASVVLLKRWLAVEPEAAVDYCRIHCSDLLPGVLGTWSETQPEKAEAAILSLPPGAPRSQAWKELCLTAAATDPEKAWALLARAPAERLWEKTGGISGVVGKLTASDPEGVMSRLDKLSPALLGPARLALSRELMKTDPARGWDWISRQSKHAELMSTALRTLFDRDPAQALSFLAGASENDQKYVMESAGLSWGTRDIPALVKALGGELPLSAERREKLIAASVQTQAMTAPRAAQALLPLIEDPRNLATAIRWILNGLTLRDPSAAKAWIESLPEGEIRRLARERDHGNQMAAATPRPAPDSAERLMADLKAGFVRPEDPRLAGVTAAQFAASFDMERLSADSKFFEGLAVQNPTVAAGWLRTRTMDAKTGPVAAQFATAWAREDPAAAGAWAAGLPPDSDLARIATPNIARQYGQYAPAEAAAWLNTLPPGPAQDAARRTIATP